MRTLPGIAANRAGAAASRLGWAHDRDRTGPRAYGIAAVALLAAGLMAGCSSDGKGAPAWTAEQQRERDSRRPSGSALRQLPAATAVGPRLRRPPGATAAAWKVFSDPAKTVSFELPQDWIAQSVDPGPGDPAGRAEDRGQGAEGHVPGHAADRPAAAVRRGVRRRGAASPTSWSAACPWTCRTAAGEGTIDPHVVFRVIQGYRYFGSYGITNMVGGADGKACALQNVVRGPAGKGDYSFGDLRALKAVRPG